MICPSTKRYLDEHQDKLGLKNFETKPKMDKIGFVSIENFSSEYVEGVIANKKSTDVTDAGSKTNEITFRGNKLTEVDINKLYSSLRSFIPAPIVIAIDEGERVDDDGVLREVCVLFVKLNNLSNIDCNLDRNVERVADKIQKSVNIVQEAAYQGGATLRQFIIDDKGAVAIVVVGLPPFTAVKNSSRGLKIALRILESGLPAQIGVTTGTCYCGTIGNGASRGDFAVVGDHINMAARLMAKAAEGIVLCDKETMLCARNDKSLNFGDRDYLRVKGKDRPISVYSPSRKIHSVIGHVDFLKMQQYPFIGNVVAWRTLQSQSDYRFGNNPQIIFVKGPKASGKTKLLSTFLKTEMLKRVYVISSRADKFEDNTPYFIFRQILYNIFEHGVEMMEAICPNTKEKNLMLLQDLFTQSTASSLLGGEARDGRSKDGFVPRQISKKKEGAITTKYSRQSFSMIENMVINDKERQRRISAQSYSSTQSDAAKAALKGYMTDPPHSSPQLKLHESSSSSGRSSGSSNAQNNSLGVDGIKDTSSLDLKDHPILQVPNVKWAVERGDLDIEMVALLNMIVPR